MLKIKNIVDVKEPAKTQVGSVTKLGNSILICDTFENAHKYDLSEYSIDLVFLDPPYNLGLDYNSYDDVRLDDAYVEFCFNAFQTAQAFSDRIILTPGNDNVHIWTAFKKPDDYFVWLKRNSVSMTKLSQISSFEPILVWGDFDKRMSNVLEYNLKFKEKINHPCPKQKDLMRDLLSLYCKDTVIDLFAGSGTTLIVAEELNKKCVSFEVDAHYCDLIIERYRLNNF